MPKTARTRGEEVFEEYLASLGRKFTYEPNIGRRQPDYLVHRAGGDVLCEIKDFELNDDDRAELEAIASGRHNAVSSRAIPLSRIQLRIRAASSQLREYKGRYPCLVVLFDASAQVHLIDFTVLGAMYGETQISIPIAHGGEPAGEPSIVFERESRYLTRTSNTTVSAVAILEYTAPNEHLLKDALAQQDFGAGTEGISRALKFSYEFGERHPGIFDRLPRLQVFCNVYAAVPCPAEALPGPHDVLWPREQAAR
jgi:hypothetical protein